MSKYENLRYKKQAIDLFGGKNWAVGLLLTGDQLSLKVNKN
jgi:hypothetical protein